MPTVITIWDMADECGNVRLTQLAKAAGVDRRTAKKWVDAGLIPVRHLPVSGWIILRARDVEVFLAQMDVRAK
jgi:predicted site-specific integrase-resolvase